MQDQFTLFRVGGIKVGVHWSWLFIFVLLTWTFASGIYTPEETGWSPTQRWVAGTGTALIFFLSVLLHELSHSFMAKRLGMQVDSITLFIFGGVSNLKGEMPSPRKEFVVAIVGPLTSIVLAAILFAIYLGFRDQSGVVDLGIGYLAFVNLALGVFNLVPGFPLDGGRVLRSIVWGANHDLLKATFIVSRVGIFFGYLLMVAGFILLFSDAFLSGLWWVFIGWFLRNSAEASYAQMLLERTTSGLTAGDVAEREVHTVEPAMTLQQLVDEEIFRHHLRAFPVYAGGRVVGLVTLTDIKKVSKDDWPNTTVYKAMTPADQVITVDVKAPLEEVLRKLGEHDINQVVVLENGQLFGFVTRSHIMQVIQARTELGVSGKPTRPA